MSSDLVLCPVCQKKGMKSKVFSSGQSVTCMNAQAFYDEEGKYHCHDPNIITRAFQCSNGHVWQTKDHGGCHCGWSNGEPEVVIIRDGDSKKEAI